MYIFKKEMKEKLLDGRTIKYLAEQKLHITSQYLTQILNNKKGCSIRLAEDIVKCLSNDASIEDYFDKK